MLEIPLKIRHFERRLSKSLKKVNFIFFFCNPVPFNKQDHEKQKGSGTSDQSLFRLQFFFFFFFLSGFSFTDSDNSQDSRGREGIFIYSTLPLPPAHEHSDIYVQLCTWDDYHIFLIATLIFTRLLLNEIYHLIELLFDWWMM